VSGGWPRNATGAAVARVEAWRNRPPEPKRTRRSTARNPNPNQLSMPL
jgi:hypothetical protein